MVAGNPAASGNVVTSTRESVADEERDVAPEETSDEEHHEEHDGDGAESQRETGDGVDTPSIP